ncbi:hypothetical protein RFI_07683 [Reticulomyxa filosa]|uniref:VHS domain-containing protein n=1 Tax=Reticulomyxa filosa TaxID=46433 RepID=X6NUI1_RETFI|nr:hypothetical protein RFI_07683 [Reticulomyxa filosa]|eukprot:ETO29439.1 hypothetical protein RFI_07683 [Reticulomyxa filosa]
MEEVRQLLNSTNPEIELLALTLAEGIIKNCPCSHGAVASPQFMRSLVSLALDQRKEGFLKKFKETVINKEFVKSQTIDKSLLLLRMLSDAYKDTSLYPIFYKTYSVMLIFFQKKKNLKKGIRFPEPTKDEDLKIFAQSKPKSPTGAFSGMGSIPKTGNSSTKVAHVDRTLPMIQPIVKIPNVTNVALMQAQDTAAFLFDVLNTSEVGQDLRAPGVILDMVAAVKAEQANVQSIATSSTTQETDLMHSFSVNEMLLQVLTDYEALAGGKKRRYEEELNVAQMVDDVDKQDSKEQEQLKDKDKDKNVVLEALDPPPSEPTSSRRELTSKKKSKHNVLGAKDNNTETNLNLSPKGNEKDNKVDDGDLLAFLNQTSGKPASNNNNSAPKQSLDPLFFFADNPTSTSTANATSSSSTNPSSNVTAVDKAPDLGKKQSSSGGNTTNPSVFDDFLIGNPTATSPKKNVSNPQPQKNNVKVPATGASSDSYRNTSLSNTQTIVNPFDTLEDPFSSMGSIKPTDPKINPFATMTKSKETTDGDDFDTGDPFAAFQ